MHLGSINEMFLVKGTLEVGPENFSVGALANQTHLD